MITFVFFALTAVSAQTPSNPSTAPQTTTPSISASQPTPSATNVDSKSYLLPKENALKRCESKPFRDCLGLEEQACRIAVSDAIDSANADTEKEAAGKEPVGLQLNNLNGFAMGSLISHMQKRTNGKFLQCARVR